MSVLQWPGSFACQVKTNFAQKNWLISRCQLKIEGVFGSKPPQGHAEHGVKKNEKVSCSILEKKKHLWELFLAF